MTAFMPIFTLLHIFMFHAVDNQLLLTSRIHSRFDVPQADAAAHQHGALHRRGTHAFGYSLTLPMLTVTKYF
jgi:hypothetical protein